MSLRERERETDRQTERDRDRDRQTERERGRELYIRIRQITVTVNLHERTEFHFLKRSSVRSSCSRCLSFNYCTARLRSRKGVYWTVSEQVMVKVESKMTSYH